MNSLRARVMVAFVLPTAAIVLVLVAAAYGAARQGMEEELALRLEAVASVVAADMSEGIDAEQIRRLDASMRRVRGRLKDRLESARVAGGAGRIFVFDREARGLVDTAEGAVFQERLYRIEADRAEWGQSFSEGVTTSGPLFQSEDGAYHKTAYAPILLDGEVVAAVGVVASAGYFALLTSYATGLTLLGALGVFLVVVIGIWFAAVLMRPVETLVEAAKRLGGGEIEGPVSMEGRAWWERTRELDFLMSSFEEMRRSILERDQQMKMMLAGIAHEVRNPLGGMELFCGLLREDLMELSKEEGAEQKLEKVARIERELRYLKRVVDDFLEFAGPAELKTRRVGADALMEEIAEVAARDLDDAGCRLELEVEEGLALQADVGKIRRALLNVVKNACQASGEGGRILVRFRDEGEWRRIEVIDEGEGMGVEQLEELVQPFATTREKGSGLGLSLTRQIVEVHGGTMEIESQPGKGTKVVFRLPFWEDEGEEEVEAGESQAIPQGWLG